MYRFGRAYPAAWDDDGEGLHCMHRVEWLAADGTVLAASDYGQREKFLAFVGQHRAPRIASHWAFLLKPLVQDHADEQGPIRYRQIEYYRMPLMAYLAVENPRSMSRDDFVRLGLVTGAGHRPAAALLAAPRRRFRGALLLRPILGRPARTDRARAICVAATLSWWSATRNRRCSPT